MKKAINLLLKKWIKGVETYTHNGSTWLIFTETKQWVIELTDSKTLWYNYNFFKQIFELLSLDVVENQHHITKWVEDNVINGVRYTGSPDWDRDNVSKDALENGVRHTEDMVTNIFVDDTLENGVKHIKMAYMKTDWSVEDTIQNGVNETMRCSQISDRLLEDTIQNGVKETRLEMNITEGEIEDIIQDGVKYTFGDKWHKHHFVEDTIQNGVRDTQSNPYENKSWIEGVIKKGVKKTKMCNSFSPHEAEDVIKNGVRHTLNTEYMPTSMVEDIIQSGVKHTEYGDWLDGDERLDDIIENGVKETNPVDVMKFFDNKMEDALQNGVKETLCGSYLNVDDIIKEGEKINGTYAGGQRQSEKSKSVVEYGTKNPTD